MTRNILVFLAIIFFGLGTYYFVHLGHYPIAIVNGKIITAGDFNNEYAAALQYYQKTMSQQKTPIDLRSADVQKEVRRATLNDLIDKALIVAELKKREGSDFNEVVASKISSANVNTKNFADAAKLLYGLEPNDFMAMVIVPQAEKELLEGRLFLEQRKLEEWLADAEKEASITLLTPEFSWDKTKVVAN